MTLRSPEPVAGRETARIVRLTGALAEIAPMRSAALYELVRVGEAGLLGEVIRLRGEVATVQVFEETQGLALGEPAAATGASLSVGLGPGLLGSVLDGVGRPLERMAAEHGAFVPLGAMLPTLDPRVEWTFEAQLAAGREVGGGDVIGVVSERPGLEHRVMVPPGRRGVLAEIASGAVRCGEAVARLDDGTPRGVELSIDQAWPIRRPRPVATRLAPARPFFTGQRVLDLLFPVAEGGSVAVPGGFGTGKTILEQSLAKHAAADVTVYIGCGERGNEMADLLGEFPLLEDPRTGGSVMDRTVLVVNTSNMPVAARDASIYLGMTIAEYFRDMGYRVAVMADSLSRWAEAHREIASRLGEMPGEEGYPTYLGNRLGQIYERAGRATPLGAPEREGSVTFISAISPPGGDLSEPVTQASLRVVEGLWALDPALAQERQFPAVSWETSYSLQAERVSAWLGERSGRDWAWLRVELLSLLQRDRELREIAGLVGAESLEDRDRLLLEAARLARELVLGQSAFDPVDASSPVEKTAALAELVVALHRRGGELLASGAAFERLDLAPLREALRELRAAAVDQVAGRAERASAALEAVLAFGTGGAP